MMQTATASRPWYEVIGVPPGALIADVRKAYRVKIFEAHPDRGGDPAVAIALNLAMEAAEAQARYAASQEATAARVWAEAHKAPQTPPPPPKRDLTAGQQRAVEIAAELNRDGDAGDRIVIAGLAGCHRAGQNILMYDGSIKRVEDVQVGDRLMGPDGEPRTVLELCRGVGRMYEIRPVKGEPWVVNEDHVLTVEVLKQRRIPGAHSRTAYFYERHVVDVTVRDWLGWAQGRTVEQQNSKLLRAEAVEFPPTQIPLPLDPYFLGVLLGDGGIQVGVTIHSIDPEMRELAEAEAAFAGLQMRSTGTGSCPALRLASNRTLPGRRGWFNPIVDKLRSLGLYGTESATKFVPQSYKTASKAERAQLLAGLLDTDGHCTRGYGFDFISKSKQLAHDVMFVARSLGLAAYTHACEKRDQHGGGGTYWRVSISGDCSRIPVRIERKRASCRRQKKNVLRTGFSIHTLECVEAYYGFVLDHDGRYLLGDFTVTHNSGKTSALVAISEALGLDADLMVVAPTGKAALRVSQATGLRARTIHRWIYKPVGNPENPKFVLKDTGLIFRPAGQIVAIDEASMVSREVWDDLHKVCVDLDLRIICVGDPYQLPPVAGGDFSLLGNAVPARDRVMLREIVRQAADSKILRESLRLREGQSPELTLGEFEELERGPELAATMLACLKAGGAIICHTNNMRMSLNKNLRAAAGRPADFIEPGEPLLVRRNNYALGPPDPYEDGPMGIFNGEVVTFTRWIVPPDLKDGGTLIVDKFSGPKEIEEIGHFGIAELETGQAATLLFEELVGQCMPPADPVPPLVSKGAISYRAGRWSAACRVPEWEAWKAEHGLAEPQRLRGRNGEERVVSYSPPHLNAELGYALTVHSAQGSEWPEAIIVMEKSVPLWREEGRRWLYTALTRAKERVRWCR